MILPTSESPLAVTPATTAVELRPVRMAILGTNFGAGIARGLARGNAYVKVAGICDLDFTKASQLAAELGVPAYATLSDLLEDSAVEAVGLYTPPTGRAKLVGQVLRAGRHVMTTKPFELDVAAAAEALELATARRLTLHLNSPRPVDSEDIAQIKAWITEYDLGRPIGMRAETWSSYREQATGTWQDDPALCPAAPIFRLGIYFLNDFAPLLGNPKMVHVMQTRIFTGRPTADNAQLAIEFENGSLANIFASFCIGDGKPWPDKVTLNYERGCIYRWIERVSSSLDMAGDHAVTELHHEGKARARATTQPGAYAGWYDWKSFHDAIRGIGNVPMQNPAAVLFGVRLLDAMRRAAISGLPERVA